MNEYLSQVYYSAQVIPCLKEMLLRRHRQNNYFIQEEWDMLLEPIKTLSIESMKTNTEFGKSIWNGWTSIIDKGKNEDIARMADAIEDYIPLLYDAMRTYDVTADEQDYELYSSRSGFLTMMRKEDKKLLHSEIDPMWEGYEHAELLFRPEMTEYHIAGCDLGYLAYQISCISNGSADIYIYDIDERRIELAHEYGVIDWIPQDKQHVVLSEKKEIEKSLVRAFNESKAVYIEKWFKQLYFDLNDLLSRLDAINDTRLYLGQLASINRQRNIEKIKKNIDEYIENNRSSSWMVIAAGPSLDDRIDIIKEKRSDSKLVCVGTVLKKLLDLGIKPDIAVVLDPLNRTFEQVSGLNTDIPLCINACANWQFAEYYTGEKYYMDRADIDNVAIMAIEFAIMAGAETVDIFGLDLAYPSNHTHASGTMDAAEVSDTNLVKVDSSDGSEVYTKEEFLTYIESAEEIVSSHNNITFVNYSKHGALIKGTKIAD